MRRTESCEDAEDRLGDVDGKGGPPAGERSIVKGAVMKDIAHEDQFIHASDARSVLFGMAPHLPASVSLNPISARVAGQETGHSGNHYRGDTEATGFYAQFGKRVLDVFLVILTLPVSIPVTLICALALLIESGQPFYQQKRIGKNGREFKIWKLRTMVRDADCMLEYLLQNNPRLRTEWDTTQKLKNDPRITPVGRFLRATSMDEIPQLFNVLTGDMSLIGPRPMLPEQLPLYGEASAYCALRPGLSGLWQVSDRNNSSFAYRAVLDRNYLNSLSLWQDITIMFRTIGVVLRRTGH